MSSNFEKARRENLFSFVLVSARDQASDFSALLELSKYAEAYFDYYEILWVVHAIRAADLHQYTTAHGRVANLRCIVLEQQLDFDDSVMCGLRLAIGDTVIALAAHEADSEIAHRLLFECAEHGREVVKASWRTEAQPAPLRAALHPVGALLRALTGRELQPFRLRAVAVSRNAITRITGQEALFRYFRLIDYPDQFREGHVVIDAVKRRHFIADLGRAMRILAHLVSNSISRFLSALAIVSFGLSALGFGYLAYSLLVLLFKSHAVEGWLSLAMPIAVLFGANFAVLGTLCLGILHVIETSRAERPAPVHQEFNRADLFGEIKDLNVEKLGQESSNSLNSPDPHGR